ncbi:MAG: hypothetical protein O4805_04015 [Trichodesmium sp. St16_bin2-tuft]|nr:hypothetical protein [Trichodesmium sp. St16_bin2-tuft]
MFNNLVKFIKPREADEILGVYRTILTSTTDSTTTGILISLIDKRQIPSFSGPLYTDSFE